MTQYTDLLYDVNDHVATITLNRPDRLNAISGPMLDRMDIFVDVPRVEYDKLVAPPGDDASLHVRERVTRARAARR